MENDLIEDQTDVSIYAEYVRRTKTDAVKVSKLTEQVDQLRGVVESCLVCFGKVMPSAAIRVLRKVLEDTK